MSIRTYSELTNIKTFEERFRYLKLDGSVGKETFGFDRYLNQMFYKSDEWKRIRNYIIVRDSGCDLGIQDRQIGGRIYVHHMNPVTVDDLVHASDFLLNPEYLICASFDTHNAIHYGDESLLIESTPLERRPNDTTPWKKIT